MNEPELIPNEMMVGERHYETALDLVIARAESELLIFDQDLTRGNYASIRRHKLLQDFLSKNPLSKLTLILHHTAHFVNACPRLFELFIRYSHKMVVYETNDHAKIAKDCFVIADSRHYLRRFHIDQARFKYAFDDVEASAALNMRFDELMQETQHTVSVTNLGL